MDVSRNGRRQAFFLIAILESPAGTYGERDRLNRGRSTRTTFPGPATAALSLLDSQVELERFRAVEIVGESVVSGKKVSPVERCLPWNVAMSGE